MTRRLRSVAFVALLVTALGTSVSASVAQPEGSPTGNLEVVGPVPSSRIHVRGWALDPDAAGASYQSAVAIFVDGELAAYTPAADRFRPDVGAAYPGTGDDHGFELIFPATTGPHEVCAAAINATGTSGEDQIIGCRAIVLGPPIGGIDYITVGEDQRFHLVGWTLDTDTANSIAVGVYVDGELKAYTPTADLVRTDVADAYPGYGPFHGYDLDFVLPSQPSEVCAGAVNAADTPGNDVVLGCLPAAGDPPIGNFEALGSASVSGANGLHATGWAFDQDRPTTSIPIAVYEDDQLVAYGIAADARPDVALTYPGAGPLHGFDLAWPSSPGDHVVCVAAQNVPDTNGSDVILRCESVRLELAP